MIPTIFRRHNDGTVTDVYEDDCVWVREGEGSAKCELSDVDVPIVMNGPPLAHDQLATFFRETPTATRILFEHVDGRQAQIARADFGLS